MPVKNDACERSESAIGGYASGEMPYHLRTSTGVTSEPRTSNATVTREDSREKGSDDISGSQRDELTIRTDGV